MIRIEDAQTVDDSFFLGRTFSGASDTVQKVLQDVQNRKDAALKEYSARFDVSAPKSLEIPQSELKAAKDKLEKENPALYSAICYSRDLAYTFALKQKESFTDFETELEPGVFTGQKTIPIQKAGVYVPAGRFALVSTVIMTVTPARAAGVKEILLCTPPRVHPQDAEAAKKTGTGVPSKPFIGGMPYADENILAAAYICGVTRAFACGGSQAIGALACGTESIPRVDVIVGPGNKFVAEAKRLVYGSVGIDMVAGPTEVFIIADQSANPVWLAADLLAQAEHDIVACPILATPSRELAEAVQKEIEQQLEVLPTKETARQSIDTYGRILITRNLEEAAELANRKAPEHLELALSEGAARDRLVSLVHNYGSLFIGHEAAEVLGDYAAGLNHTLPTNASARFTGGLSVRVFLKTVTTLRVQKNSTGLTASAEAAAVLGDAEGLAAHAKAARLRLLESSKAETGTFLQESLTESITAGITLCEAVDFFKMQCDISVDSRKDQLRFETGIFDFCKKPTFFFSLMRIFENSQGKTLALCLDIRFPPDTVNARFSQTAFEQNEKGAREQFFSTVKASDSFTALKNAKLHDFSIKTKEYN